MWPPSLSHTALISNAPSGITFIVYMELGTLAFHTLHFGTSLHHAKETCSKSNGKLSTPHSHLATHQLKMNTNTDTFALRYDDYDYGEVNRLLERGLKLYIKAVACYPDSSKTPLCPLSWAHIKASEKVIIKPSIIFDLQILSIVIMN